MLTHEDYLADTLKGNTWWFFRLPDAKSKSHRKWMKCHDNKHPFETLKELQMTDHINEMEVRQETFEEYKLRTQYDDRG